MFVSGLPNPAQRASVKSRAWQAVSHNRVSWHWPKNYNADPMRLTAVLELFDPMF
jgi:hypothetical protein